MAIWCGSGAARPPLMNGRPPNTAIHVDKNDFVWIGGNGDKDNQILKFTLDGKFVMQIGKSGENKGSNDTRNNSAGPPTSRSTKLHGRSMSPTDTATVA